MWSTVLDFFFPRRSPHGEEGEYLCASDRAMLTPRVRIETGQELRSLGIDYIDSLTSAIPYRSPILRKLIRLLKYHRVRSLHDELLSLVFAVAFTQKIFPDDCVLCPVPLHWTRKYSRGENQAERLARMFSKASGIPFQNFLRRTRPTGHQAWRRRAERLTAMRDAFALRRNMVPPRNVILIDDIATTGATLNSCAQVLKRAGAERVDAWVIAKG